MYKRQADYVPHKHFVGLNNTVLSAENCQAWLATWLYIEWVSIIAFTCELTVIRRQGELS